MTAVTLHRVLSHTSRSHSSQRTSSIASICSGVGGSAGVAGGGARLLVPLLPLAAAGTTSPAPLAAPSTVDAASSAVALAASAAVETACWRLPVAAAGLMDAGRAPPVAGGAELAAAAAAAAAPAGMLWQLSRQAARTARHLSSAQCSKQEVILKPFRCFPVLCVFCVA